MCCRCWRIKIHIFANRTKPNETGLGAFHAIQAGNEWGLFYSSCGIEASTCIHISYCCIIFLHLSQDTTTWYMSQWQVIADNAVIPGATVRRENVVQLPSSLVAIHRYSPVWLADTFTSWTRQRYHGTWILNRHFNIFHCHTASGGIEMCVLLGRVVLGAQQPIVIKLSRGRSVHSVGLSVPRSVQCIVENGRSDPDVFGIIAQTSPGMRQVVEFTDRSTGRGTFGGNLGAPL